MRTISLNLFRKRLIVCEWLNLFNYFEVNKTFSKFEILKS